MIVSSQFMNLILYKLFLEQREMQELARKFTKDEIIPKAAYFDKTGEYPIEIVKKAHALGLMNGHIPQDCGKLK